MKCKNEKCNIDLYENEEDYFICPYCHNLIQDNLPYGKHIKTQLYAHSLDYKKISNFYQNIIYALLLSPIALYIFISVLLSPENDIFRFSNYISRRFFVNLYILPMILVVNFFSATHAEMGILRDILGNNAQVFNTIRMNVIKIILYIVLFIIVLSLELPFFHDFISNLNVESSCSFAKKEVAIDIIMQKHLFLIIYTFVMGIISEIIHMIKHKKLETIQENLLNTYKGHYV